MNDPRLWGFIADMNLSGSVTISDVWLWVKWLFFYPGDYLISTLITRAHEFSNFFEITYDNYGGIFSGIISFWFWSLVGYLWYLVLEKLNLN